MGREVVFISLSEGQPHRPELPVCGAVYKNKWRWCYIKNFQSQQKEAAAIRADMRKAAEIIEDGIKRYVKAKLKLRSKKQADDAAAMFADLTDYGLRQEIDDAYGWDVITLAEHDRLLILWDAREQYAKDSGKYRDRVVEMLEYAMRCIGDQYQDVLCEADTDARENERRISAIERSNMEVSYKKYQAGIRREN